MDFSISESDYFPYNDIQLLSTGRNGSKNCIPCNLTRARSVVLAVCVDADFIESVNCFTPSFRIRILKLIFTVIKVFVLRVDTFFNFREEPTNVENHRRPCSFLCFKIEILQFRRQNNDGVRRKSCVDRCTGVCKTREQCANTLKKRLITSS